MILDDIVISPCFTEHAEAVSLADARLLSDGPNAEVERVSHG